MIGIDPSIRNTAVVVLAPDASVLESFLISTSGLDTVDAMIKVADEIVAKVREHAGAAVFIESPAYGSFGQAVAQMSGLAYVIRTALRRAGVSYRDVAPTTVKKFACGSGRAKKNLVIKSVYSRFGFDTDDDNIADAYAIARYGLEG